MLDRNKIREKIQGKIRELFEKSISGIKTSTDSSHLKNKTLICVKEIELEDDYIVVKLQGAVDASTIPLAQEQRKNYKDQFDKHIIIDFKDAAHIDCSTLAILVDLFTQLKSRNKKIIIINATKELIAYTDILRLNSAISILADKKEAIAYLSHI